MFRVAVKVYCYQKLHPQNRLFENHVGVKFFSIVRPDLDLRWFEAT